MAYKCLKCSPLLWPPSSIFRPIWLHLLFTFTLEVLAWVAHMHSHWRIKLRNKHIKVISKMQECISRRNSGKFFRRLLLTIKFSNRLLIVPFAVYAFIIFLGYTTLNYDFVYLKIKLGFLTPFSLFIKKISSIL